MGAWEEQAKRTTQNRKLWSETQQFNFIHALQNATNEEEVKAAYVREFSGRASVKSGIGRKVMP